jgi:chloride channel protein, CIC family
VTAGRSTADRSTDDQAGGLAGLIATAMVLGVAVAVGIRIFKWMIEAAEWLAHGWLSDTWVGVGLPWVLLVPALGGLLVGVILHLAAVPEEPGHGVSEVIEAVTLGTNDFPERHTPVKASVAALSLGAGASLGPEDPAVEIGGSIGHFVGRRRGLPRDSVQALVAAGGTAGLAAAFHAPVAAVVFAVEVFRLRPLSRATGLVTAAVIPAYLLTRVVTPVAEPAVPAYGFGGGWELSLCVGLGVIGGALSAGQIRLMYTLEIAVIRWRAVPRWLKPALGGLVLGVAGLQFPELLGIGYGTLEAVLRGGDIAWTFLLVLAAGKAVLMAVSFGTGFLGGFFAPALFVGAALGGAYGIVVADLLPGLDLSPPLFAAAGMVAVLAGSVRAPLAAVLVVVALSGSYLIAPLLLVAAGTGYWTSRLLEHHSLYTYGIVHPAAPEAPQESSRKPADESTPESNAEPDAESTRAPAGPDDGPHPQSDVRGGMTDVE